MPTLKASGSLTPVVNTETNFEAARAEEFTAVLVVDLNAYVGGATPDIAELRVYVKPGASGDTEREAYRVRYAGGQIGSPIKYSVPIPVVGAIRCTLKQTQGTARAVPWWILAL